MVRERVDDVGMRSIALSLVPGLIAVSTAVAQADGQSAAPPSTDIDPEGSSPAPTAAPGQPQPAPAQSGPPGAQLAPVAPAIDAALDPAHETGFVTLDRFDASSRIGLEASFIFPAGLQSGESETALRFEVHGQYVDPHLGLGGYAQFPLTYVTASADGQSTSGNGIGNIELGGLYVLPLHMSNVAVVLRAGVTLPTASDDSNQQAEAANLLGALSRFTDFYLVEPKALSGRFSGSLLVRSGHLFARADFGVDANASTQQGGDVASILHVNAGLGYDVGQIALGLESVNLYDLDSSSGGDIGSSWINVGAASLRYHSGRVDPYFAVVFPIDHDSSTAFNAAITIGADGVFSR